MAVHDIRDPVQLLAKVDGCAAEKGEALPVIFLIAGGAHIDAGCAEVLIVFDTIAVDFRARKRLPPEAPIGLVAPEVDDERPL